MLFFVLSLVLLQSPPTCATSDACRAEALIAEAAGQFETFHDLAWRAVQKGKPNDPELMTMLARAMALSGRPGDAIVMLERLADMGVKVETGGDEFRVVRTLKDWPRVAAKLAALSGPPVTDAAPAAPPSEPAAAVSSAPAEKPARPEREKKVVPAPTKATREPKARKPAAAPGAEPEAPAASTPPSGRAAPADAKDASTAAGPAPAAGAPVLDFDAPVFTAAGLAYDAVSRRFVVGDRDADKLLVLDERSHHVVTLVSAAGAHFLDELGGLAIDPARGDLWVVSASRGSSPASAIHKLQLVSGRTLMDVEASGFGDVRLVDVAVTADGSVYVLDAEGGRLLRLPPRARALEVAASLHGVEEPRALAVGEKVAFVSGRDGLVRVDLGTGRVRRLRAPADVPAPAALQLDGMRLFAVVPSANDDPDRLVELRLNKSMTAITAVHDLDTASAVAVAGGKVYYLSTPGVIKALGR